MIYKIKDIDGQFLEYESDTGQSVAELQAEITALKRKAHTFGEVAALNARLSNAGRNIGQYYIGATPELLRLGLEYHHANADYIRDTLQQGGADAETIAAALYDFGGLLCGLSELTATPEQMAATLRACPTPPGPFACLLECYRRNINKRTEYEREVKQTADVEARKTYFNSQNVGLDFDYFHAAALDWLLLTGYITAHDFAGIEQETIKNFLSFTEQNGQLGAFIRYFYLARVALNATAEQLAKLTPPAVFLGDIKAALFYSYNAAADYIKYLAAFDTSTPERTNAPTAGGVIEINEEPKQSGVIAVPENYALMLGGSLYVSTSVNAPAALTVSPIMEIIAKANPGGVEQGLTNNFIEKIVEGIVLLTQFKRATPENNTITIQTNFAEFATICGLGSAPGDRVNDIILAALHYLSKLYISVPRGNRRTAFQLFDLRRYDEKAGRGNKREIVLHIFTDVLKGRQQFVTREQLAATRRTKSATERRFLYQIKSKNHANEEYLLNKIFGYDERLQMAEYSNDGQALKRVKNSIRTNKPHDRERLQSLFNDWAAKKWLTYTRSSNTAGIVIYKWKKTKDAPQKVQNENE